MIVHEINPTFQHSRYFLGGLLSAVGSLVSAGVNAEAQQDANETNLKIAQMNNEWNYKMFQEQMQYNTDMWNKQNEYNSAANQRKRLEEAGLNPYLMMDGGNAGTAQSASGVNPPQAQQVQVQPVQYDLSTAAGFLQQAIDLEATRRQRDADSLLKESQAQQITIESQYTAARIAAEMAEKWANARNADERTAYQRILNGFAPSLFSGDVNVKASTSRNLESLTEFQNAQKNLVEVNKLIQDKHLKWLDSEKAANLAEIMSRVDLNKAQKQAALQSVIESEARTAGINISNETSRAMAGHLVSKAFYESVLSEKEAYMKGQVKSTDGTVSVSLPFGIGYTYSQGTSRE